MFDLTTIKQLRRVHAGINGLDGIMYDEGTDRIVGAWLMTIVH